MAVAIAEDVGVALGRPLSGNAERAQVEWWLSGVEIVIRSRLGDITLLDQEVLKYVEVEVVASKVRHSSRDESSITVAVDDGSVTRRFENPVRAGDLDDWWNLLNPDSNGATASIRPSFEADTVAWPVSTPPTSCPEWFWTDRDFA